MSAPSPDFLAAAASTTSSGFADGLGRRVLAFDREVGSMLERLVVRPEIAAFEKSLRARVEQVAALEDQRIARPRTVERDADGALVVVSEFVPGSRLSDLLELSAAAGVIPGIDAACGYLLDVLPALCGLHGGAFAHGTIAPSRTVLTPAGEVVLLDVIYGDALSHLRYSRQRLWTDFGVAVPPAAGAPRLGFEADIAQVALSGMMLVIGRALGPHEYPGALAAVMREVAEAAQIRGSAGFADGLLHFFHRALALPGSRAYSSADDALIELRELGNELGPSVCRRALVEFIEQMESGGQVQAGDFDAIIADIESYGLVPARHQEPEAFEAGSDEESAQNLDQGVDAEIDLEELVEEPQYDLSPAIDMPGDAIVIEPAALTWPEVEVGVSTELAEADPSRDAAAPDAIAAVSFAGIRSDDEFAPKGTRDGESDVSPALQDAGRAESRSATSPATDAAVVPAATPSPVGATFPIADIAYAAQESAPSPPLPASASSVGSDPSEALAAGAHENDQDTGSGRNLRSRRAKRTRSTRARKDKLRSVAAAPASGAEATPTPTPTATPSAVPAQASLAPPAPAPSAPPVDISVKSVAPPPPDDSWLVPPDRAAAFDPPVADPAPAATAPVRPAAAAPAFEQPAAPFTQPPVPFTQPPSSAFGQPRVPAYAPPPAYPQPSVPSTFSHSPAAVPGYSPPASPAVDPFFRPQTPVGVAAAPPVAWTPSNPTQHSSYPATAPQNTPLKLKEPATSRPRGTRAPAAVTDIYSTPAVPAEPRKAPVQFPWKMAGAALALVVVAVIGGRTLYLPERADASVNASPREGGAATTAPARQNALPGTSGKTGRLEIETQPAGARVLLDGKPAGESPLALDRVPIGRHTLTFVSASGSVERTVRIEAGRTVRLDVPIFSGWVGIFAPFVVRVSEDGRAVGTTEEPRIMLSPGRHVLTLSNKELGYKSVHTVEIVPGEVRSVTLDPRGSVNLNASPWAEVWIDGKKAGDTPMANHPMPLGTREIVFRHPQFGERKVLITVKADGPAAVSVDMEKP